jgi:ACS family glucarate transporter-like MFS transporter
MQERPTRHRYGVVGLLIFLFAITYLDRVCISVAGPRIQQELHIGPIGWGWVTGIFALSYCLFEIPTGALGDRIGPRRVLTRIVLWWSTFTAITGAMSSYYLLLLVRFLFGAGEAGAFPNASVVISRWFPPSQRATMLGVILMSSQIGGAIAPLLVVPIQMHFGWRASFYMFGVLGVIWATVWYCWFRDSPAEKSAIGVEAQKIAAEPLPLGHQLPWRRALRSQSVLAILGMTFCYVYVFNFFQTWFHTFLIKGRGFSEAGLLFSALPFAVGACANLAGGVVSDALVRVFGLKSGRRILGVGALAVAGVFTIAAMLTKQPVLTVVLLTLVYGAISFQQTALFGVCLDIGAECAGAMVGLMNTSSQIGGLLGAVMYGYIAQHFGSYDAPFVPMAVVLFVGSLCWLRVDASQAFRAQ